MTPVTGAKRFIGFWLKYNICHNPTLESRISKMPSKYKIVQRYYAVKYVLFTNTYYNTHTYCLSDIGVL